jgi:hypothetical protein
MRLRKISSYDYCNLFPLTFLTVVFSLFDILEWFHDFDDKFIENKFIPLEFFAPQYLIILFFFDSESQQ